MHITGLYHIFTPLPGDFMSSKLQDKIFFLWDYPRIVWMTWFTMVQTQNWIQFPAITGSVFVIYGPVYTYSAH